MDIEPILLHSQVLNAQSLKRRLNELGPGLISDHHQAGLLAVLNIRAILPRKMTKSLSRVVLQSRWYSLSWNHSQTS
ncbi:uncharacterized protein TrAtP1_010406 [Trichoderma atroviride]|uniref:uncharacterized protein n=1 Tax=Hypocrea atroviridis TaxID=63577 RepID=UPI003323EBBB|nr:hypothetical protein TrAtP1_010406 [Trichoderma atroviride]